MKRIKDLTAISVSAVLVTILLWLLLYRYSPPALDAQETTALFLASSAITTAIAWAIKKFRNKN